jgi:hypothetical protein
MSIFVLVDSIDKKAHVIINMDDIQEVAPFSSGGCLIQFRDGRLMKVKDSFDMFKQFVMQTVTTEQITDRIASIKAAAGVLEKEIPPETVQPKRGRPAKDPNALNIPKFDGFVPTDNE